MSVLLAMMGGRTGGAHGCIVPCPTPDQTTISSALARMSRRTTTVRAAAVEGLRHIARPEARGLLELYSKDKEPAVRKAAEAALR